MNLYRLTFRDKDGNISVCDTSAPNMQAAAPAQSDTLNLVKIERLHPSTGEVLGGFYNE
jgi:hypothetical protein